MSEKVKCGAEFDEWVKKTLEWKKKQEEMLETEPTPEKVEEITKLYTEIMKKGKEFASCEIK